MAHRTTGLFVFANLITGGHAEVELLTDGRFEYAVGRAIAPVDVNAPVASQRRIMAEAKRHGRHTVNMVHLNHNAAEMAGLNGGGHGQGLYQNVFEAIRGDNRLDRLSAHDRKALVKAVKAAYEV